jgi:hypothetical protein
LYDNYSGEPISPGIFQALVWYKTGEIFGGVWSSAILALIMQLVVYCMVVDDQNAFWAGHNRQIVDQQCSVNQDTMIRYENFKFMAVNQGCDAFWKGRIER